MTKAFFCVSVVLVLIATLSSTESSARGRKHYRLAQGTWGAAHISVNVGESSATIEFDCAHGQIDGPLATDRRGRFDLKGTYAQSAGQPARYTGWTDGKKMTLTVTLAGRKEVIGTFNLARGGGGRIFKCR